MKIRIDLTLFLFIFCACSNTTDYIRTDSTTSDSTKISKVIVEMGRYSMTYLDNNCTESIQFFDDSYITRTVNDEFVTDINSYSNDLLQYTDTCEHGILSYVFDADEGAYRIVIIINDRVVCEWTCIDFTSDGPTQNNLHNIKPLINFIETIKKHSYILGNK